MDKPEILAAYGTQDDEKQTKNTTTKAQANTNNVNKIWAILQTAGGKDEPTIVFMR